MTDHSAELRTTVLAHLDASFSAIPRRDDLDNVANPVAPLDANRDAFAHYTVYFGPTLEEQVSIGAPGENRWLEEGAFEVTVYVPSGSGGSDARTYARQIWDALRGQLLDGGRLEIKDKQAGDEGERYNGVYWGNSFGVEFEREFTS